MRYARIYLAILRANLVAEMNHRVNFVMRFVGGVLYLFAGLGLFLVVFAKLNTFGGWNESDTVVFVATTYLVDLLWMTVLFFNVADLPNKIASGQFDLFLMRPVSPQFQMATSSVNLGSASNSIIGIVLLIYGVSMGHYHVSLFSVACYILLLINGVALFYSTFLLVNCLAFWQSSFKFAWVLIEWFYDFAMKPDVIYRGGFRFVLTYFLPAMMLTSFPARALMGRLDLREVSFGLGLCIIYMALCQVVWHRGLRRYASVNS